MPLQDIVPAEVTEAENEQTGYREIAVMSADVRGVASLLDMLRLYASLFVSNLYEIMAAQCLMRGKPAKETPSAHDWASVYAIVGMAAIDCRMHNLEGALDKCSSIQEQMQRRRSNVTCGDVHRWLGDLRERIESDLKREHFLQLSRKEAKQFENPLENWEGVVRRFRKVQYNIEEANKCFALGRYGAAVFHVTLVAEFGVIKVAELFGVQGDRPGWGALERLQKINGKPWKDRSPLEQQHGEFLKNTLPLAIAIKDSWRHKMDHVDNQLQWMDTDFSPQVASEIVIATCGFMRRLADDLPQ